MSDPFGWWQILITFYSLFAFKWHFFLFLSLLFLFFFRSSYGPKLIFLIFSQKFSIIFKIKFFLFLLRERGRENEKRYIFRIKISKIIINEKVIFVIFLLVVFLSNWRQSRFFSRWKTPEKNMTNIFFLSCCFFCCCCLHLLLILLSH